MFDPNYYTVKEFALQFHLNEDYVRRRCRGDMDSRTGKKYKLPKGWEAFKPPGGQWRIGRTGRITSVSKEVKQNNIEKLPPLEDALSKMFKSIRREKELEGKPANALPPLPDQLVKPLMACREGAIRGKRRHVLRVIFESEGVIKVELLQPSGELLFNRQAALFYLAWLKMAENNPYLSDARDVIKYLKRITAYTTNNILFTDFQKRCLSCTKYLHGKTQSLYCKDDGKDNCKKNLSRFIRSLEGESIYNVDKKVIARLARLFKGEQTLRIEPGK